MKVSTLPWDKPASVPVNEHQMAQTHNNYDSYEEKVKKRKRGERP